MKIAKKFTVIGRVQGVGFRYYTNSVANSIGVYGYVKNLYDGSVEVYAIGTKEQVDSLKDRISSGPSYAHVDRLIEEDWDIYDYISFSIKY